MIFFVTESRVTHTDFGMGGGTCPPIGGDTCRGDKGLMGEVACDLQQNLAVSQISKKCIIRRVKMTTYSLI